MKIESWIFGAGVFFFVPVSLVYGFLTNWGEWVGILGILLVGGLAGMIGGYLGFTGKRVGLRPGDTTQNTKKQEKNNHGGPHRMGGPDVV